MGNSTTKKEEKKKKEEKEEEKDEVQQRKAAVSIIPWDNQERNKRFSELKISKDEVFVSTIFNIKIEELELNDDDDDVPATKDMVKPDRSVLFDYDCRGLETTACIYTDVDETDDTKNKDYIKLSLTVEILKNLVIYTFHQYNGKTWTMTEIDQKVGCNTVDVDVYAPFTTRTIYFTMRYMREDITVTRNGFEYRSDFCTHQRISFPEGAVQGDTKIAISALSIESETKKKRVASMTSDEECIISGLSDIVYVHHSQPFKKKVKLRLRLDNVSAKDVSHEIYYFHCDGDGSLKIMDGVEVSRVVTEETNDEQIYEVEVDTFSGLGATFANSKKGLTRVLGKTFGLDPDYCRILVFLLKDVDDQIHLWSDIVQEEKLEEREEQLKCDPNKIYLRNTVSPTVSIANFGRVRITVSTHGRVRPAPEVPVNSNFMYYDRNAAEIFNHFPIVKSRGIKSEAGIIQYESDTPPKRLLHTAYFNSELYMDMALQPKTAKRMVDGTQRRGSKNSHIPDR